MRHAYKPYKHYFDSFFYCRCECGAIKIFEIHSEAILINAGMRRVK